MLPPKGEISAALRGLGLLLRGDASALLHYDVSEAGFWRSFRWPLITGAVYVLLSRPDFGLPDDTTGDRMMFILVQSMQILLGWAVYLGVMAVVSRSYGLGNRYAVFVVLYNWCQAIVTGVSLPLLAGNTLGIVPDSILMGWSTALLLAWFYIVAQAARLGLQAGMPVALAAAVFDFVVSLLVYRLGDMLL